MRELCVGRKVVASKLSQRDSAGIIIGYSDIRLIMSFARNLMFLSLNPE